MASDIQCLHMSKTKRKKLERRKKTNDSSKRATQFFKFVNGANQWSDLFFSPLFFFLAFFLSSLISLLRIYTHTLTRTTEHILPLNCLFSFFRSFYVIRCCRCKLEMLVLFTKCKHFFRASTFAFLPPHFFFFCDFNLQSLTNLFFFFSSFNR